MIFKLTVSGLLWRDRNSKKGEKLSSNLWIFFIASQPASERFLKSYLIKITSQRTSEDSNAYFVLLIATLVYVIV